MSRSRVRGPVFFCLFCLFLSFSQFLFIFVQSCFALVTGFEDQEGV